MNDEKTMKYIAYETKAVQFNKKYKGDLVHLFRYEKVYIEFLTLKEYHAVLKNSSKEMTYYVMGKHYNGSIEALGIVSANMSITETLDYVWEAVLNA